ncbi:Nudix hydrolase domain-containing protein [Mycena indigotica]|uniref:Nudix hydrolase domain-containing protein n=1 Tax=Mycena indigotica TaxID=2126181 RepID=A0A8H6SD45_9AGAR|nr:Nudix hydrolase domain-containing protein [Mycena indigotica]KAF7297336.1 Nudix hydrolase domain-containing protein [Mycena indigotica]
MFFFNRRRAGGARHSTTHHSAGNAAPPMSEWSTAAVPNSAFASMNLLLGAGMVIFQEETNKIVLCHEKEKKYWFLPRGRKDVGESLEQAALREAYEESGFRVKSLPLYTGTHAPSPPSDPESRNRPNCEPLMITTHAYARRKSFHNNTLSPPGEYLSFWYAGWIPIDAVREEGTGMPDEVNYESYLLTVEQVLEKLGPGSDHEANVVRYAWAVYQHTMQIYAEQEQQQALARGVEEVTESSNRLKL